MPKRKVVTGSTNPAVGGDSDILLSQGTGTQTSTGVLLSSQQWIDFYGDNSRPVFVGIVVDKLGSANRGIGGRATATGQAFYKFKITKGTGGSSPKNDLTDAVWTPGTSVGALGSNTLPPSSLWTIDFESGDNHGRRQYGFRIGGGVTGLTLRIQNVRIVCFSL